MKYESFIEFQGKYLVTKTTICIKVYGKNYESTRNYETTINSISSSNRWSNKED